MKQLNKIREIRRSAGLSQAEVSRRSGVEQVYLSKLEHGHHAPTVATLEKLARAIRCSVADLLPRDCHVIPPLTNKP